MVSECESWGRSIKINRELPEESFHGPSSELQIYNFLEWGPDLEGFIFTDVVQKEPCKWFQPGFLSRLPDQC